MSEQANRLICIFHQSSIWSHLQQQKTILYYNIWYLLLTLKNVLHHTMYMATKVWHRNRGWVQLSNMVQPYDPIGHDQTLSNNHFWYYFLFQAEEGFDGAQFFLFSIRDILRIFFSAMLNTMATEVALECRFLFWVW